MLKLINNMSELNIENLLAVHVQSNQQIGLEMFPHENSNQQLQKAEDMLLAFLREDFFRQVDACYAVWSCDGCYMAVLRLEPYYDGMIIEGLETLPNVRGLGYAKALLSSVIEYLHTTKYKKVYSHISKKNIPSLRLHTVCGFQHIWEYAKYIDGTVTWDSCTMCYYL